MIEDYRYTGNDIDRYLLSFSKFFSASKLLHGTISMDIFYETFRPLKNTNAVYFLCSDDEITYIGSTINFVSRILTHSRTKKFERIFYVFTQSIKEMIELEKYCIKYMNPKINKVHNPLIS